MDKTLLENCMAHLKDGHIDAIDGIYQVMSRTVYLLAFSVLKNPEKAKDIMQETFVKVLEKIDKYELDTNAAAWISKIARNLSITEYKKSQRTVNIELYDEKLLQNGADVLSDLRLLKVLNCLTVEEREIAILYTVERYKHKEIAQIVNKPLGTVLWIYNRALKKLKKQMDREGKNVNHINSEEVFYES